MRNSFSAFGRLQALSSAHAGISSSRSPPQQLAAHAAGVVAGAREARIDFSPGLLVHLRRRIRPVAEQDLSQSGRMWRGRQMEVDCGIDGRQQKTSTKNRFTSTNISGTSPPRVVDDELAACVGEEQVPSRWWTWKAGSQMFRPL